VVPCGSRALLSCWWHSHATGKPARHSRSESRGGPVTVKRPPPHRADIPVAPRTLTEQDASALGESARRWLAREA
jgi:hypothetical protein